MIKKNFVKSLSVLLSLAFVLCVLSVGVFAYADDMIAINSNNFADANFRAVVSDWYDENGDGYLSQDEISGVTLISISGMLTDTCGDDATISDLKGIEFFTSCKRLRCGGIGLVRLNVSAMPQLVELTCAGNELVNLDVSHNTNLEWLNCSSCMLESLDVSNNTKLTKLECYVNSLSSLDVSANTGLTVLRCQQNNITRLNVRNNTALRIFNCSKNNLMCIDLSANVNIEDPTASYYGDQVIEARALIDNGEIYVRVPVDDITKIVSSSLDKTVIIEDVEYPFIGYVGNEFVTENIEEIMNGIDYNYNVGLEGAENMTVHINIVRDFYQVKFFTDETKAGVVSAVLVNKNASAQAPQLTDYPQCKVFEGWVGDYTDVTEDREIYALWRDDHNIRALDFTNGVVTVDCDKCHDMQSTHLFAPLVNTRENSENYVAAVDMNHDGVINGKDFAYLLKMNK